MVPAAPWVEVVSRWVGFRVSRLVPDISMNPPLPVIAVAVALAENTVLVA